MHPQGLFGIWKSEKSLDRHSRMALNLLKGQTKHKVGIKTKRLCCGWNHGYLLRVLTRNDQGIWMRLPCPRGGFHFTGEIRNATVYDYPMLDSHVKKLHEGTR